MYFAEFPLGVCWAGGSLVRFIFLITDENKEGRGKGEGEVFKARRVVKPVRACIRD